MKQDRQEKGGRGLERVEALEPSGPPPSTSHIPRSSSLQHTITGVVVVLFPFFFHSPRKRHLSDSSASVTYLPPKTSPDVSQHCPQINFHQIILLKKGMSSSACANHAAVTTNTKTEGRQKTSNSGQGIPCRRQC